MSTLSKAERAEVERHKYNLSQENGYDVGVELATQDWLQKYANSWRVERQTHMMALQREEIQRHKWIESEKACHDLGNAAVFDWISKYAAQWRDWYNKNYES